MLEKDNTITTKKDAMTIGSNSLREGIKDKTTNIALLFRAAGMWHFYFPSM